MDGIIIWVLIGLFIVYSLFFGKTLKKAKGTPRPCVEVEWPIDLTGSVEFKGSVIFDYDASSQSLNTPNSNDLLKSKKDGTHKMEYLIRLPDDSYQSGETVHFELECRNVSGSHRPEIEPCIVWIDQGEIDFSVELAEQNITVTSDGRSTLSFDQVSSKYQQTIQKWQSAQKSKRAV